MVGDPEVRDDGDEYTISVGGRGSPDGARLAWLVPDDSGARIVIADADGGPPHSMPLAQALVWSPIA